MWEAKRRTPARGLRRYSCSVDPCRIVIADDSMLIRAGIEAMLETETAISIVGQAASLDELLERVATEEPDVVVTDVRMPPGHFDEGIVAAGLLRSSHPAMGVVVLSQFADAAYLQRLVDGGSGRRGYLLKDRLASPGELARAINLVHQGGAFIDPTVVELLVDQQSKRVSSPLSFLTSRETEILAAIASGKSNAAIGQTLFVGHRAVEKHINSIFSKLGLHDDPDANRRVAAVLLFLQSTR